MKTRDQDALHSTASYTSKPLSQSFSPVYTPSEHHASSTALASALSLYQLTSLSQSVHLQKQQEAAGDHQRLSGASLWSHDKRSSAMQCKANQYVCVLSESITHLHRPALAKHPHLCPLQETLLHGCGWSGEGCFTVLRVQNIDKHSFSASVNSKEVECSTE